MKTSVILTLGVFVLGLVLLTERNNYKLAEAHEERTFKAIVTSVKFVKHQDVDCPQLNEVGKGEEVVIRLTLDRKVAVWSEVGTGDGEDQMTASLDLPASNAVSEDQPSLGSLVGLIGKGETTFHYSLSFLSVCDKSRIPVVEKFRF